MSRWGDEIQTAMHPAVWHLPSVDPRLCIQVVLKFTVNIVDDRLPAEEEMAFTLEINVADGKGC